MKRRINYLLMALFAFLTVTAYALNLSEEFRYFKPVPKAKETTDVLRIILDSDIYDSTSIGYRDVRISDSKGTELPFIIKTDVANETQTEYAYSPAKITSLKKLDDNRLEICIEIPAEKQIVSGLTIRTPSKNFEKQVTVEGSSDMSLWKPVCQEQAIFDYSEVTPLSNSTIKFDGSQARYFRLTIANFKENRQSPRTELINEKRQGGDFSRIEKMSISSEHLKIDEIGFLTKSDKIIRSKSRTNETPVIGFAVNEIKGKTEITFSTRREPLGSVKLETGSINFTRNYSVSISEDGKVWQPAGMDGKLTSIDIAGYKELDLSVSLGFRSKFYRITIINGDAPPLKFTGAKAYGIVTFLEMINSKDSTMDSLSVYYCGKEIPAPSYDTYEILSKLKNPTFSELKPGPQEINPAYKPGLRDASFLNNKTFFTAVIVAMVLLLSWILIKSFRKIESMNSDQ